MLTQPAYDLAQHIAKSSGILKELYSEKDKGPEEVERYQNIEELLAGIKEFTVSAGEEMPTLADFMIDVALLTDADNDKEDDKNKITMMTIHSSKGLEFPHVYLVGLEENLFPSQLSINSRSELEEERRLFYVAVTRAEKTCTISYASSRFQWGNLVSSEPSRFIGEIAPEYLSFENPYGTAQGGGRSLSGRPNVTDRPFTGGLNKPAGGVAPRSLKSMNELSSSPSTSDALNLDIKVGYNVMHDRFGKGKVTKLEGSGVDKKATIFFPHAGAKTLLLRFAKLTVLED
jgi:DNA helicase-2/ATP-dependent DNA helicase PcrA